MSHAKDDQPTFEDALHQLEGILRDLEDGSTSLEQSLQRYEKGVGLLKLCYGQLRDAEQRIVQLTGIDEQDDPITTPFAEHSPESGLADGRGRTRTTTRNGDGDGTLPF